MDAEVARMPGRQDARDNRVTILQAAAESLFGPAGADPPSLHREVIRRTGLARATVYRHFRDRGALAGATIAGFLRLMKQDADGAVEPGSFRPVLGTMLRFQAAMRPAASVLRTMPVSVRRRHVAAIVRNLTPAFERAQARGELRPGMSPADLEVVLVMLDAAAHSEAVAGSDVQRFIDLVLDGLFSPE